MSMSRLEAVCREQDAKWLHRLSLGIDDEEVCSKLPPAALSLTLLSECAISLQHLTLALPHRQGSACPDNALQVKPRKQPQSIGCGKTFRGASALKAFPAVHTWLVELGKELEERVAEDREEHARLPRLLTVVSPGSVVAFPRKLCPPSPVALPCRQAGQGGRGVGG